MKFLSVMSAMLLTLCSFAQQPTPWQGKFEQLDQLLPTPNEYRSGSGAPGPKYWQQKADYVITAELNDSNQSITGSETITYSNNSPDVLRYVWLQLDQNNQAKGNNTQKIFTNKIVDSASTKNISGDLGLYEFDGGFKIKSVTDVSGNPIASTVNYTMMRIDLPQPLNPGQKFSFSIEWSYNISDGLMASERTQFEYFPEDGNYLYAIAQWFPRMCVYDDYQGWQNKQFLGQGEFALPFGDYIVTLTVPADHIVGATGTLQNPEQVLTKTELERFEKAKNTFDKPVVIVTQAEVVQKEKTKSQEKKTWIFKAENVRDFAFASSRKFIWDVQAVKIGTHTPLAMSFYPKEGNPLWGLESTKAVKNTLITYSKYTIDYPYPVAISVHAADQAMEYPMICFNPGRPEVNGSYTDQTKYNMLWIIIHEVGHNFFPMIINSDERQWTWMDEGVNTFVQYRTEVECYPNFPHRRGPASLLVPYMIGDKSLQRPLMVNSEQVVRNYFGTNNFGNEQYAKCATSLNMLRETVMGPALFDKSFKEYAQRWAFKHPKPADFFRTMEDASAVDLDWFWRGWFYTTDNVDLSIDQVKWYRMRTDAKSVENKNVTTKQGDLARSNSSKVNISDFSAGPQPFSVIPTDDRLYGEFRSRIDDKAVMNKLQNKNIYEVKLSNKGGLVMPIIIQWTYKDGSKEIERIPAEIWRINEVTVTKVFVKDKEVVSITLDPLRETSDVGLADNLFPRTNEPSKFDQFKSKN